MTTSTSIRAAGFGVTMLASAAFTTGAFADGETIAVFTKNQTNPYFQTVRVGADVAAKSLGAKTLHYICLLYTSRCV